MLPQLRLSVAGQGSEDIAKLTRRDILRATIPEPMLPLVVAPTGLPSVATGDFEQQTVLI